MFKKLAILTVYFDCLLVRTKFPNLRAVTAARFNRLNLLSFFLDLPPSSQTTFIVDDFDLSRKFTTIVPEN